MIRILITGLILSETDSYLILLTVKRIQQQSMKPFCHVLKTFFLKDVLKKYSTVLDFMLNLRTCLAGLEQDWSNENLGRREERRTRNYTHHRINIIRLDIDVFKSFPPFFIKNLLGIITNIKFR